MLPSRACGTTIPKQALAGQEQVDDDAGALELRGPPETFVIASTAAFEGP